MLAAALGALYSCLVLWIPGNGYLPVQILLQGACAMGMVRIGYGIKKGGLLTKAMVALYLSAFLCGGLFEVLHGGRAMTVPLFLMPERMQDAAHLYLHPRHFGQGEEIFIPSPCPIREKHRLPVDFMTAETF